MEFSILKGHKFPEAKGLCIVIDVLRAFTTAAFAFASGAKEIIFVSTPEEAFKKHQSDPSLILMGEQEGQRIDGFHFENSPREMQSACLSGKRIVQRTSSGTQGVNWLSSCFSNSNFKFRCGRCNYQTSLRT